MSENQRIILQMVSDGKLSVDEATKLLNLVESTKADDDETAEPKLNHEKAKSEPYIASSVRYTGFARVHVSSAVEIKITHGKQFAVEVTPDNDREVIIEQDKDTLSIRRPGLWGMWIGWGLRPKVRITMPDILELKLSGACSGTLRDFNFNHDLKIGVKGASQLRLINMEVGDLYANMHGASGLTGDINVNGDAYFYGEGASRVELNGSARKLKMEMSGASNGKLAEFPVRQVEVDFNGASNGWIRVDGKLDATISGVSNIYVSGSPVMGSIITSGGSHLHHR